MSENPAAISAHERGDVLSRRAHLSLRVVAFGGVILALAVVIVAGIVLQPVVLSAPVVKTPRVEELLSEQAPRAGADEIAEAQLVTDEDHRVHLALARELPSNDTTLVLGGGHGTWTLPELVSRGAVKKVNATTWRLVRSIVVQSGQSLDISTPGGTLQLVSGPEGFTSIVAWSADLRISGSEKRPLALTSWNPHSGKVDTELGDGRAYIRTYSGNLSALHAKFSYLGFWSGRTGGLASTGSAEAPGTADIRDVTTTALEFGLFLDTTVRATVHDSTFTRARLDGLALADGVTDVVVTDSTISAAARDGIHLGAGTGNVAFDGVTVADAGHYGLQFAGGRTAAGASAAGGGGVGGSGLTVTGSTFSGNADGGIVIDSAADVLVGRTSVTGDRTGVRVSGASDRISLSGLSIESTSAGGIAVVNGPATVTVTDSRIVGRPAGVIVRNATVTVLSSVITTTRTNSAAILFDGVVATGHVSDTVLHGSGPDAISQQQDVGRAAVSTTDASGWSAKPLWVDWIETHPTVFVWVALLLVPAIGAGFVIRNRRRQRRIRLLVEETTLAIARAEKARYDEARRLTRVQGISSSSPSWARGNYPAVRIDAVTREVDEARQLDEATPPVLPPASAPVPSGEPTWQVGLPPVESARAVTPRGADADSPRTSTAAARAIAGRFGSIEDLAVSSVIEGGKSVQSVARTLKISPQIVQNWVDRALR